MAQFLKIKEGITINADAIDYVTVGNTGAEVNIILTSTFYSSTADTGGNDDGFGPVLQIAQSQVGKSGNLVKAINRALTSNPGGRVIEVGPGDYTIGALTIIFTQNPN